MMDKLRVIAAYLIKESNLTKAAKLQLVNFLENEATDAQVMALLLDGKVQILDEMAEEIVYARFKSSSILESSAKKVFTKLVQATHKAAEANVSKDILGWKRYGAAKAVRRAQRSAEKAGLEKHTGLPKSKVIRKSWEKPALKTAVKRTGVAAAGTVGVGGAGVAGLKARKKKARKSKKR
jgi:hypothetical protein